MNNDFRLKLLKEAAGCIDRAYAPYSRFEVGAALLSSSGRVFTGVNVESQVYGLTICAERVALVKAISEGVLEFRAVAVVARIIQERDNKSRFVKCWPCGACLQMLSEFALSLTDFEVITGVPGDETLLDVEIKRLNDLLPHAFRLKFRS